MNIDERHALLAEVRQANRCSHPIRIRGEMVHLGTGEVFGRQLLISCKDRRSVLCPSCSYLYKADAFILIAAGLLGGKGIDESIRTHPSVFLTLTAPSFGPVHHVDQHGHCHRRTRTPRCRHGNSMTCGLRHEGSDFIVGAPLCTGCFDYEGAILWNATSTKLWNVFTVAVRRELAKENGISRGDIRHSFTLSYFKVAEFQQRGLVHFHSVIRIDGPDGPPNFPPDWATSEHLAEVVARVVRSTELRGPRDMTLRFGRQFHVAPVRTGSETGKVASYLAKYAVKTTDGTMDFAHRFKSEQHILRLEPSHRKDIALATWRLGADRSLDQLTCPRFAHTFGFRGNLITKSRHYSTTFTAMRNARAEFMAPDNEFQVLPGTFHFNGRGYDHPKAKELAELFFQMDKELRSEAAERRRQADLSSEMSPDMSSDSGRNTTS
jgi:hypothetical protein